MKFSCNRKLIGARYFFKGFEAAVGNLSSDIRNPRDITGHGTHTLSTAGGSPVPGANVRGFGNGTAKGGSPRARVAAYKACWTLKDDDGCFDADILAAFDAAIHDGVDVLSVSLGSDPNGYFENGIAIGAFHAITKGISVVASAGNSGPKAGTLENGAPWLLTVGASTMDRQFPAFVIFGEHKLQGESLSNVSLTRNKMLPLIRSRDAAATNASYEDANLCTMGSLDATKVKGKIVVCFRGENPRMEKGEVVKLVGGKGMVLVNDLSSTDEIVADPHVLPATHISYSDGLKLFSYLNSTKSPEGFISYPYTMLGTKPAPFVASFSSRGPNIITPEILKPDIIGPGVNIIAAYTKAISPTGIEFDEQRLPFNIDSGTSMSCPHIAGIVSLLKALHPEWTPSAIKSAIMTTASLLDNMAEPIKNSFMVNASPFSYGSGHVWPSRAMDPGLVYDLDTMDYLNFLCSLGYKSSQISTFKPYKCPSNLTSLMDLNYPSITVPNLKEPVIVVRRLKNVGTLGTYVAHVQNR
ncbi:hypothetical protein HPP92_027527 [Vanilla planifolia]|uniref:Uncharacterized protein n=2 Tax=Vanilla planifolia TaxID=51239 RepID=A0A835P9L6_VANPL|nr:hypothetical protein HPP92_027527 [Vanilla planifolia]